MIPKHSKSKSKSKSKSRTRLRKPKFLSLRLQLIGATSSPMPTTTNTTDDHRDHKQQLINLFPLHPDNNKLPDDLEHDNMASIFSSCDDGPATTLTGILCSDDERHNTNNPSPSSVNYADEEVELVRTAMRRTKTERVEDDDDDHEKWVCYSEVVERKKVVGGMSSSSSSSTSCFHHHHDHHHHNNRSKLVLKLDYEKVIKSWVNKGPLYIHSKSDPGAPQPQTVPDLQDDDFFFPSSINGLTKEEQENGGNGGSWTVPEMPHIENNDIQGDEPGESSVMIHNREASVQRYKEKRRNRLFAKTIRYEVRKLNAEKRPRIKGRFVKRN